MDEFESSPLSALTTANKVFRSVKARYDAIYDSVHEQDQLTQDLLHKLELEPLNAVEMTRLAKQLKTCRQTRRQLKDEADRLYPIVNFLSDDSNAKTVHKLSELIGQLRKVDELQQNRRYYPRVLKG